MMKALITYGIVTGGCANDKARRLSFADIAGYTPGSDVVQHSRLDLDQQEMEAHLANEDFAAAKNIYENGGNSGARAVVKVGALTQAVNQLDKVSQGGKELGYLRTAANAGDTSLSVTYTALCKKGGSSSQDSSGCITTDTDLMVETLNVGSPTEVSHTYRTLAGFSTEAQTKMGGQQYFEVYRTYFNSGQYAHNQVMNALDRNGVCSSCDAIARAEIAKKTSAYMNVWMYIIREYEDAIMDCQSGCSGIECNMDPVHAWDEGWAFYAGSLEGTTGDSAGVMPYRLAEKRCKNFGTCQNDQNDKAEVNVLLLEQAKMGLAKLQGGKCIEAIPIKERMVQLMSVPLVQGALRYAWFASNSGTGGTSKEKAEGHAFMTSIIPRVAACDASKAKLIYDNMRYDASPYMSAGYASVKAAFESTYECLGITCANVGGIVASGGGYEAGAKPCEDGQGGSTGGPAAGSSDDDDDNVALIVIIVVVAVLLVAASGVAAYCCMRARKFERLIESGPGIGGGNGKETTVGVSA